MYVSEVYLNSYQALLKRMFCLRIRVAKVLTFELNCFADGCFS